MKHVVCVLKTNEGALWAVPQLQEMRLRGHKLSVLLPPGDGGLRRELTRQDFNVLDSEFDFRFAPRWATLRSLAALRRQLRDLKPDVLFYHLYASALASRIASIGTGVRRVHMVAGPLYLESRLIRLFERWLALGDHLLIAGSEYTAQLYRGIGFPASRLRTIPYGVDLARFSPEEEFDTPEATGHFTAIMVAYVYAPKRGLYAGAGIKGHGVLLEAWKAFQQKHPDSRLILVGAGFDSAGEAYRQALRAQWGVDDDDSIQWIDSVPDVRPWYRTCDVSISPSLSENHGAALEASAMALPSIVSDAGALPEAVAHGYSGWIVPAGDVAALTEALEHARKAWEVGRIPEMGASARRLMLERFDRSLCVRRVADEVVGAACE